MDKRELKEYYNTKARQLDEIKLTYEHQSLYKRFFFKTRFHKVIDVLQPRKDEKILDLGCGPGYYTRYLANLGCKVVGIDISDEYINQAKKFAPGIKFLVGDASKLPFKNNSFDKVLMTEAIEHLQDDKKALSEIKRVLRKDGILVITTPNKYSYMNLAYSLKRKIRKYEFNEHLREYSQSQFTKLLSKYFQIENVYFSNYLVPYPIDNLFINIKSKKIIRFLDFLEEKISNSYLVRSVGWTMIYKVKKT